MKEYLHRVAEVFYIVSTEVQKLNGQSKAEEWAGKIAECKNSGILVNRWCRENGVCEQTFYKWQRKLLAIENGSFQWPRIQSEVRTLTPQQYRWLMSKNRASKANKSGLRH